MFKSFFPNPRIFFLSVVGYAAICSFIWYGFNEQIGAALGFDLSPAEPVIGLGHFLTDSFLLFYIYYFTCTALFAAAWHRIANHPWQWWSIGGSALILFSTYFSVQVSVAINNWRRPFFDLVQDALKGVSCVIHTASPPHGRGAEMYFAVNVVGDSGTVLTEI